PTARTAARSGAGRAAAPGRSRRAGAAPGCRRARPRRAARPSRARRDPEAPGDARSGGGPSSLLSRGLSILSSRRHAPPAASRLRTPPRERGSMRGRRDGVRPRRGPDTMGRRPAPPRRPGARPAGPRRLPDRPSATDEGHHLMELALLAVVVGVGVGIVVGALGAGGGILAVPVLVFLLGMPAHSATASSLIIVLITALASLPHHARHGNVDWRNGLVFAGVSVVGAVLGSRLSALVPAHILLTLFGVMLVAVAVAMLRRGLRTRTEERAEAAAHGAAAAQSEEPVATHDDPVLDQPGP